MTVAPTHESAPAIPWQGLHEALRAFSGRGQLYRALGSIGDSDTWSADHVRRRANRVLFSQCIPALGRMPTTSAAWLDALPAESHRRKESNASPSGRVDWLATRLTGWPPQHFATSRRYRQPDEVLTTTLAWVAARLCDVHRDAVAVAPGIDIGLERQLATFAELPDRSPVSGANAVKPGRPELTAVRASGRPWVALADLAHTLAADEASLDSIARHLLYPDDDLRWRLFHLACLGLLLQALRANDCYIRSLRPIGIGSGPVFRVIDKERREWDLWFEGAGMWSHYKVASPYSSATAGLPGAGHPLGADLVLIRRGDRGLLIECKYSADATYVGRNGYEQALSYLAEARSGLIPAGEAAVIGPTEVVAHESTGNTVAGPVTIGPPGTLGPLVHRALSASGLAHA